MNRDFPFLERYSDQRGANAFMHREILLQARVCMPVKILAVTRDGDVDGVGTVDCQPLIDLLDHEGNAMKNAPIYGLPYIRLQAGGNAVIIDPQPGDVGIAVFCDRDISSFMANGGENSPPGSRRIHSLSDGVYVASIITQAPAQYIRFFDGGIEISSPVKITVGAPDVLVNAQTAEVVATTSAGVTAPVINLGASGQTLREFITSAFQSLFNIHTHPIPGGNSSPPNQQLGSSHMTTTVKGG